MTIFLVLPTVIRSAQDDPVEVHAVNQPPHIDGVAEDHCWQSAEWQSIDQVWIPYGETGAPDDFSGRYKIVWSPEDNLLYFLVEVVDDVLVDGFVHGETADVYNFDIIEVFLDEDHSGGKHVFDGRDSVGVEWGTNAENAFAYHIYGDIPDTSETTSEFWVHDQDGTSWETLVYENYANHFPDIILRRDGSKLTWEFSLKVYTDDYEYEKPEGTRAQLTGGKEMGLSVAYCENDDPDEQPKERDKFYGSVPVPEKAYNDHWINADWFGTVILVEK